jgi:1-acyl-sn-glycerol-3-phosphate acyltransferase
MLLTKRDWVGTERIPKEGGVVIAGNHISHLDPLTFAHVLVDNGRLPRYLGKAEVFKVPVVGTIITSTGQIPVHRLTTDASAAFAAAVQGIHDGKAIVVYPEGTISRDPDLWPMVGKTGAARIALTSGAQVIPIAQWGANEILFPYAKRPHFFPRKTLHARVGDPVDLDDLREQPITPALLHQATDRIMDALTRELEIIRGAKAPAERFDPKKHGVAQIGNPYKKKKGKA